MQKVLNKDVQNTWRIISLSRGRSNRPMTT